MFQKAFKQRALKSLCSFQIEKSYGSCVALGLDEVGRGCIAGPVVAAGVIFDPMDWGAKDQELAHIDDSKVFSSTQRGLLHEYILKKAVCVQVAFVDAKQVDQMNILQAAFEAFRSVCRDVEGAGHTPEVLLVDGNQQIPGLKHKQHTIVGGDRISKSVAAASIVAKVERDRWMRKQAEVYPEYGFEQHKGYGTQSHYKALEKYGPCPIHRMSFLKKFYDRQDRGKDAEAQVLRHYQQKGLQTLHRNWRSSVGEIDLVMECDRSLRFVEVRYREDANLEMAFPESKKKQFQACVRSYLDQGLCRKKAHLDLAFVSPKGVEVFEDFLAQ